jgi:pimeloyl-ACP methyl ester carboxylesterase
MLWTVLSVLLVGVLALVGFLLLKSPGRPLPVVDGDGNPPAGGIAEKIRVDINGMPQGMFITGRDASRPVLLFVHGGPGMPEYFLTERYPTGLEEIFTVCWWDQRGAGLSYRPDLPRESLTVAQLVDDTLAVTNYLRERFGQEKIYLMGHSGGSLIGILAAARAPKLYHSYIGVAQMAYQRKSETVAHAYMLEQYKALGNTNMVRRLEAATPTLTEPLPAAYVALRDEAMHTIGVGTTRDMRSVITGIFVPSWLSPAYTLGEKVNLWRGKFSSLAILREPMFAMDLTQLAPALDLPVYFMHGRYDYTVTYAETKAYFDQLDAPRKGFYTFEQSAHSPMFEEPERMRMILQEDVLTGANRLADAQ